MKSLKERVIHYKADYAKVGIFGTLLLVLLFTLFILVELVSPKVLEVTFFDVGQGDAIFIQTPSSKQMLIDGGATNLVLEKLEKKMSYFDRSIDIVIATHGDADHVTGLIPVFRKYEVKNIIESPVRGASGIFDELKSEIEKEVNLGAHSYVAKKGDEITFGDGVSARILYPNKNISSKMETNDASVSILIMYGEHSFLLTGDLSSSYEPRLITASTPKKVTVYKAGHHGSKTSSGELLLSRITPGYSVISAGKDNKYGHPNEEAIERLQKYSEEILSTIDKGSITFVTNGRLMEVETEK